MLFQLRQALPVVLKCVFAFSILIVCHVAFETLAYGQPSPTVTFQGRVVYSTGEPAQGATVTMTKTKAGVVSTSTLVAGSGGSYTFTENQGPFPCGGAYEFRAVSVDIVDDEPLPPSGATSISGGCLDAVVPVSDLVIPRPKQITLGGIVKDTKGLPVQGVTVTMTRTKYNLNPQVVTVAQTTTNAAGHYQFTTWSRCAVVEDFRASAGTFLYQGGTSNQRLRPSRSRRP